MDLLRDVKRKQLKIKITIILAIIVLIVTAVLVFLHVKENKENDLINQYIVNPCYYSYLRIAAIIMILLSVYAIAYTLPYAIIGYTMGAGEVRAYILDDSILPASPLTTVAVGVGFLAPLYILMFFLCLITPVLKKYSTWMFITSLTYLVTSAPAQARDGFIMIPLTYYFVYRVFRNSLDSDAIRKLNKLIKVFIPIVLL